ncbi:MAG: metal ABC transporter permease [Planctomycetota bacterium]
MTWTDLDTRIVSIAVLVSIACALPGTFLVLKRMSMLTHAIAHAVLPGLVLAFFLSGSLNLGVLMLGAMVVGVLTSSLIQKLSSFAKVEGNAAIGVVFTAMLALGLLLLRMLAEGIHLHADCVIEGRMTLAATDTVRFAGLRLPTVSWLLIAVVAMNAIAMLVFWRPLVASVFDPDHARLQGLRPEWMHQGLMGLTAITTVAAFEAVGSILVVALMVIPGATAVLLATRLPVVLALAVFLGISGSAVGHVLAVVLPRPMAQLTLGQELGDRVSDTSSAGMIAVVLGLQFLIAALCLRRDAPLRRMFRGGGAAGRQPGVELSRSTPASS